MNRGYTRARYLELIAELRETVPGHRALHRPHRGLPRRDRGGLRADGRDGRARCGYDNVFAFRYSRRPGHARRGDGRSGAGRGEGRPQHAASSRSATRVGAERSRRLEGRTLPVLVDGVSRKNAGEAAGRTRCNRVVNFDARGRDLLGRVVPVRVTGRCRTASAASWPARARGPLAEEARHVARDEGQGAGARPALQHADHHPARRGGEALAAHLGRALRGQRHRARAGEDLHAAAHDARPDQEHPRVARRARGQDRGQRPPREHLLRGHPPPAGQRRDHGGLAARRTPSRSPCGWARRSSWTRRSSRRPRSVEVAKETEIGAGKADDQAKIKEWLESHQAGGLRPDRARQGPEGPDE